MSVAAANSSLEYSAHHTLGAQLQLQMQSACIHQYDVLYEPGLFNEEARLVGKTMVKACSMAG